ncbi:type I-U CRISPR-associated protein Csx17 [Geitlerinema sp. PCC 9228]|uniref:type I-G CRISPR-associated protein Cas8g1/Csx17 n=1 Tax=Geitlerinema sp. PCC 9228 TaxID=111611 RepID=UPI0009FBC866|nr:type I-U CRISPR-associated protein Csx17 [Geitlerinema sp. PCC 9228]
MPEMLPEILLKGCATQPLSNYLKALGILRLVAEQEDSQAKGYWYKNGFVVQAHLSGEEIVQFLLHCYQPTPLISPWNGSTGFHEEDKKANKKTLEAIATSTASRFQDYRKAIAVASEQVQALRSTLDDTIKNKKEHITKKLKSTLMVRLRNRLPDDALRWLDTCALVTDEKLSFPPLLGTGGNDGNFEFSRTFMQQLLELFDLQTGNPQPPTEKLLRAALFGDAIPNLDFSGKIGQFNPIAAGGPNASVGFQGESRVNPWDYILMVEGTLLFAAGATRRYERSERGTLAYPFTVQTSDAGYGSASPADAKDSRGELWTPLWSAPTGLPELQVLFREGRAKVGNRSAKTGVDFARAVSSLGIYRGLDGFVRYGFQVRNGLSYFAVPLGWFDCRRSRQRDWLRSLDVWLDRMQRATRSDKTPASLKRAYRRLQGVIMDFTQNRARLLDVLVALGEMDKACDRSLGFMKEQNIQPLPQLPTAWIRECQQECNQEESVEFRLALSLRHSSGQDLRKRLVRVREQPQKHSLQVRWREDDDNITTWRETNLVDNLISMLRRQDIEQQQGEKQEGEKQEQAETQLQEQRVPVPEPPYADLKHILAWIDGKTDDRRLEAFARGLSLVWIPDKDQRQQFHGLPPYFKSTWKSQFPLLVRPAYALVAIAHRRCVDVQQSVANNVESAEQVNTNHSQVTMPRVPALLTQLAAGRCIKATQLASRRLRASGLRPAIPEVYEPRDRTRRIAAALAFSLSPRDAQQLLRTIQISDGNDRNAEQGQVDLEDEHKGNVNNGDFQRSQSENQNESQPKAQFGEQLSLF